MRAFSIYALAAMLAVLAVKAEAATAGTPELLSLQGLALKTSQYIDGFKIETLGVRILAVCHIPMGWHLTAGHGIDQFGELSGESQGGVANINKDGLSDLNGLFLIAVEPDTAVPFRGTIRTGYYGRNLDQTRNLRPENLKRVPAARCPNP